MAKEVKFTNPDTIKAWRLTRPISGGPVFDFPAFGMKGVNLNDLTPSMAERLHRKGWAGIEPVKQDAAKTETPFAKGKGE